MACLLSGEGREERCEPQVKGPKYREACKHHPMICRHLHTLQVCGGAIHALDLLLPRGQDALNPKPKTLNPKP